MPFDNPAPADATVKIIVVDVGDQLDRSLHGDAGQPRRPNALPTIQRDFNASVQGLEWSVNAYTLTFAVLLLTGAALGDRYGMFAPEA